MSLVSSTLFVVLVILVGVLVGVWVYVRSRALRRRAQRLSDGTQEARIVVDQGYTPSRIALDAGVPTTLRFERREDDPCSELLVSELWPSTHRLVPNGETQIHFTPVRPGRFVFTCGMGMYSGEFIVRTPHGKHP